jgi:hypothetical protein
MATATKARDRVAMPVQALDAALKISAVLAREPTATNTETGLDGSTGGLLAWSTDADYVAWVDWSKDGVRVKLDPSTDAEWALAERIIGWCAYHGVAWEAP